MKKWGILNSPLSELIATMGHGDGLCIADAGLPIPNGPVRIDLALTKNIPSFLDVLEAILGDLQVEESIIAREMIEKSPHLYKGLRERLGQLAIRETTHDEFKEMVAMTRGIVRTGEFTPYANIILKSGVVF
jgi:D-ribose pyranase